MKKLIEDMNFFRKYFRVIQEFRVFLLLNMTFKLTLK